MHLGIMLVVFLPYLLFFPKAVKAVFQGLRRKDKTDVFLWRMVYCRVAAV